MGYEKQFELYGENYRILVMETKSELLSMMRDHAVTIMLMLALNILFPGMAYVFHKSIVSRLMVLSKAFDEVEPRPFRNSGCRERTKSAV